jgi:hypothetical protein
LKIGVRAANKSLRDTGIAANIVKLNALKCVLIGLILHSPDFLEKKPWRLMKGGRTLNDGQVMIDAAVLIRAATKKKVLAGKGDRAFNAGRV